MSYRLAAYIVPGNNVASARELARQALAAVDSLPSPDARGPTSAYYVLVRPPGERSAAWCFTFATTSAREIDRLALRDQLRAQPAFHTLTEVYHHDQRGRYIFEHWGAGEPLRLVSVGPYLGGDVARVTCDVAQKGYSNEQLAALHAKEPEELTARERRAIMEYENAVAIGLRELYPAGARYLELAHVSTAWRIGTDGSPGEAPLPAGWDAGANSELEDDHPFIELLEWVADAGA